MITGISIGSGIGGQCPCYNTAYVRLIDCYAARGANRGASDTQRSCVSVCYRIRCVAISSVSRDCGLHCCASACHNACATFGLSPARRWREHYPHGEEYFRRRTNHTSFFHPISTIWPAWTNVLASVCSWLSGTRSWLFCPPCRCSYLLVIWYVAVSRLTRRCS